MTRTLPAEVVIYSAELEPVTRSGALTGFDGRAVPYGLFTNRGFYMEGVAPGAFDKSIKEAAKGLPLLLFHDDTRYPVGLSTAWDSRADALYGSWSLDDSDEAQRAGQLAMKGMLRWLSVGFSPIRSEWAYVDPKEWNPDMGPDHMDKVTRVEARLVETSLLTVPAFASAEVMELYGRTSEKRGPRASQTPSLTAWRQWLASVR